MFSKQIQKYKNHQNESKKLIFFSIWLWDRELEARRISLNFLFQFQFAAVAILLALVYSTNASTILGLGARFATPYELYRDSYRVDYSGFAPAPLAYSAPLAYHAPLAYSAPAHIAYAAPAPIAYTAPIAVAKTA